MPRLWLCYFLFVSLFLFHSRRVAEGASEKYLQYSNVEPSAQIARSLMQRAGVTGTGDRLAVMILYSMPLSQPDYGPCFKCAMESFATNLAANTPCDFFIFVKVEHLQRIASASWMRSIPTAFLIALDETDERSWKMPDWIRPERGSASGVLTGWAGGWSEGYRLMGQWRLAFSFPFAHALGYKYVLQTDSDTYVQAKVDYNLVNFMREHQLFLTNRDYFFYEDNGYFSGLPELVHFWLVSRVPWFQTYYSVTAENASKAGIKGPLIKHCSPPDLTGLFSGRGFPPDRSGWDAQCIAGNFNLLSLDWWFQEDVQDFVQLVLRTGAHIEVRWVDVATESMIGHLFCPEEKMHVFKDLKLDHGRGALCSVCGVGWNASDVG